MLFRSISKHVKDQNWFAVLLDFFIVVVGVGVAMMGQQWLGERQQRADMRIAEAALQFDLFYNYENAKERLAVADCRVETYRAIATKLLEPEEKWTGMPRVAEVGTHRGTLPNLLRSPSRDWGSRHWESGLARGTFNQMEEVRRDTLDSLFKLAGVAERLQDDIYTLQGQIKTLAVTTTIGPSDRLRYYDMLGALDDKSGQLEIISQQIIDTIHKVGIELPDEFSTDYQEDLKSFNARGLKVYGSCFTPIEWSILDK